MAVTETNLKALFADKAEMRKIVDAEYRKMGIVGDPSLTIEQVQAMVADDLRAAGVRPEDNDASCAIIAAREEF